MVQDLDLCVVRDLAAELPFEAGFVFGVLSDACPLGFWDSSSFRSVTVAAVHVDVESSADLTDSALACTEVMLMISRYNAL
jgi:hypothetical protein